MLTTTMIERFSLQATQLESRLSAKTKKYKEANDSALSWQKQCSNLQELHAQKVSAVQCSAYMCLCTVVLAAPSSANERILYVTSWQGACLKVASAYKDWTCSRRKLRTPKGSYGACATCTTGQKRIALSCGQSATP